jgi:hypothetical protein
VDGVYSVVASALNSIAESPDGAQAMVDAMALDVLIELLGSDGRRVAADMLQILATHDFVQKLILKESFCNQLVYLLRRVPPAQIKLGADNSTAIRSTVSSVVRPPPSIP